jgi:hypothetical protein
VTDGVTVVALLIDPKTGATIRQATCVIVESSRVASVHLSRSSDGEQTCYVNVRLASRSAYSYPLPPPADADADAGEAAMHYVMPMQSSALDLLNGTVAVWGANHETPSHGMMLVRSDSGTERLVHTWVPTQ